MVESIRLTRTRKADEKLSHGSCPQNTMVDENGLVIVPHSIVPRSREDYRASLQDSSQTVVGPWLCGLCGNVQGSQSLWQNFPLHHNQNECSMILKSVAGFFTAISPVSRIVPDTVDAR